MQPVESRNPISPLGALSRMQTPQVSPAPAEASVLSSTRDQALLSAQPTPHLLGPIPGKLTSTTPAPLSSELKAMLDKMATLVAQQNQKPAEPKPTQATQPTQPTQPTPAPQTPAPKTTYTVQKGDSLSKIAQKTLGDGNRWREIYELNRGKLSDPNRIFPGQVLTLPGGAKAPPVPSSQPTPPPQTPQPAPAKRSAYVVQKGDSLSKIAQQTLGDANRWREIYDLNRDKLSNPNTIIAGQELALPGGAKQVSQPAKTELKPQGTTTRRSDPSSYFVSQYRSSSNAREDANNNGNCGPTSLTMVALAFNKVSVSSNSADEVIESSRRRMGAGTNEYEGTSFTQLVKGAESYGLNAKVVYGKLDTIQQELNKGRLLIAHVIPTYLNPNTTSTGHYAVVTKVADGKVYLNDPISTSGPVVVSADRFLQGQKARGTYGLISIGG